MEINQIKDIIKDLLSDEAKLSRTKISQFLIQNLKPYISKELYELLKYVDDVTIPKRKSILETVMEELSLQDDFKPKVSSKKVINLNISISDMDFLNKKQKHILLSYNLNTLIDVLWYFPYIYENRILTTLRSLKTEETGAISLEIEKVSYEPSEKYPLSILAKENKDYIHLKFKSKDNSSVNWYKKGQKIVAYGRLKEFRGQKYMVHPKIFSENSKEINIIKPIYPLGRNTQLDMDASTSKKRKLLEEAIELILNYYKSYWQNVEEILPKSFLEKHGLIELSLAFNIMHKPQFKDFKSFDIMLQKAKKRFLYEEIFIFELAMLKRRAQIKSLNSVPIQADKDNIIKEIESHMGFSLTNAQKRAIEEISIDMNSSKPMSRLLQGDVGSGKTAVAMACSLACLKNNMQVALMAPTEILANQHFKSFKNFFEKLGYNIGLLTSSTSKTDAKKLISMGVINIVIGTHALIQEDVTFKELGLVIVDEQHRFGVAQRQALLQKNHNILPHMLYMSATPIPRTIAMGIFGDMDISVLDEMPSNRKPVKTYVIYQDDPKDMDILIKHINKELSKGRKIYIVYPLIEESEKIDLKAATMEYEKWKDIFKDKKVLLLHGKMNDAEKSKVMEEFKENADILVSTTVIEVGIDVPTASTIVIEDAHRFGLSQLHQLRGRVGRGGLEGYCFLTVQSDMVKSQKPLEQSDTLKRLKIMVKTNNGFEISMEDFKMRGPGDVLGLSQSGFLQFNNVDLKNQEHLVLMSNIREEIPSYKKEVSKSLGFLTDLRYFKNKDISIA